MRDLFWRMASPLLEDFYRYLRDQGMIQTNRITGRDYVPAEIVVKYLTEKVTQ